MASRAKNFDSPGDALDYVVKGAATKEFLRQVDAAGRNQPYTLLTRKNFWNTLVLEAFVMLGHKLSAECSSGLPIPALLAALFRKSVLTGLLLVPALSLGQVAFVQENNNTVGANSSSVSVTYSAPETTGNLNLVAVGWSDTDSSVISVVDDNNNVYALAGTSAGNGVSQAIYYAAGIALGTNNPPTVTVTFNQSASTPDVRILEYSGLSTTATLDNWTGSSGNSALADSGAAITSSASLIVGAGTTATIFTAAGSGFTSRAITNPFGDIVEDSSAALAAGSYNATAALSSGPWVMQMAAFSTTGVTYTNSPAISTISPASGPSLGGTMVTITGTDFQPGAVALFGAAPGGISLLNCTESGGTTLTCLTPSDSTGAKDVTVVNVDGKLGSALSAYTYADVRPTISAINPPSGPTNGSAITITGTNFQTGATVTIGGLPVGDVAVPDSTTITGNTPGLPVGPADVKITNPDNGTVSSPGGFTYTLGTGAINYIQHGSAVTNNPSATLAVTMPDLQAAGNLNVAIVGWADATANVLSVTDSEGNTYAPALPLVTGTGLRQVIYYAKNIAGDSSTPNQITVTFDQAALFPDVRVLEYSGLDTAGPLDATAVAGDAGSGTLADSGACTTTTPVELIVAGATVSTRITAAGTGFTILDLTQPNGDNAQHQITSVAGSCEATAALPSGDWVMQSVAFKLAPPPPPDFTVSALPATRTVAAGSPASYTVTVAALNGFNSAVALTCDPLTLPTGATCAFVPTPVTPGASAVDSALTISTTSATPVGTSSVTLTGTSGLLSHSTTVGLTVTAAPVPDFTVTATALSPASVAAGGTATSTVTIAPVNGFNSAVNLTCAVTPVVNRAPTCSFVPTSVAGGSGTSTLTVSTRAATTSALTPRSRGIFYAMWLPVGLAFLGTGFASRKRKFWSLVLSCLVFSGLIFLAACGGSSSSGGGHPGTPAGSYTVTVTGTSSALTHSQTVTVAVQ